MHTLIDWLTINLVPHFNPKLCQDLLKYYQTPRRIINAPTHELQQFSLSDAAIQALKQPNQRLINNALKWLQTNKQHHCLTLDSTNYPEQLRHIADPPILLYISGNPDLLNEPQIAIVGSRNCTPTGQNIAFNYAQELTTRGYIITSGMALGIDGSAHQGCIANKLPTIAVLGSGLLKPYPAKHRQLFDDISQQGAVISEYPLYTPPRSMHFPQRNRIISGLSLGVLVVEATLRSGSLITAKLAAEQGKEVFAVPSSIYSVTAHGCHKLIQTGAKLVQNVQDIIEELPSLPTQSPQPKLHQNISTHQRPLDDHHKLLLKCVGFELTHIDEIASHIGQPINTILPMLLTLELHGYIKATPNGYLRVT